VVDSMPILKRVRLAMEEQMCKAIIATQRKIQFPMKNKELSKRRIWPHREVVFLSQMRQMVAVFHYRPWKSSLRMTWQLTIHQKLWLRIVTWATRKLISKSKTAKEYFNHRHTPKRLMKSCKFYTHSPK